MFVICQLEYNNQMSWIIDRVLTFVYPFFRKYKTLCNMDRFLLQNIANHPEMVIIISIEFLNFQTIPTPERSDFMEFKFLKLRDLQGKTPTFPTGDEIHIIYVPEPESSNMHKPGSGRAMIKEILSYYLHIDKSLVRLHESKYGKPYLAFPLVRHPVYFNISHTNGYLAFALSTSTPVGIDIENIERNVRLQSLIGRFFHEKEIIKFLDYTKKERKMHFIRYWTLKEALLKGLGIGITISFTSFRLEPESERIYYAISDNEKLQKEFSSWRIRSVPAPKGYMCSISYLFS